MLWSKLIGSIQKEIYTVVMVHIPIYFGPKFFD